MRWAENDEKFSRPIRWVVSIWNDNEMPVKIIDIQSSRYSRGHRFAKIADIEIKNANKDDYIKH